MEYVNDITAAVTEIEVTFCKLDIWDKTIWINPNMTMYLLPLGVHDSTFFVQFALSKDLKMIWLFN